MKNHETQPDTMENQPGTMENLENPWKPTKHHEKPWNYLEKAWKPTKNHDPTLKNHGNQPKTMRTMIKKRYITDTGPQPTSMIKKCDVSNGGAPTDLHD